MGGITGELMAKGKRLKVRASNNHYFDGETVWVKRKGGQFDVVKGKCWGAWQYSMTNTTVTHNRLVREYRDKDSIFWGTGAKDT